MQLRLTGIIEKYAIKQYKFQLHQYSDLNHNKCFKRLTIIRLSGRALKPIALITGYIYEREYNF